MWAGRRLSRFHCIGKLVDDDEVARKGEGVERTALRINRDVRAVLARTQVADRAVAHLVVVVEEGAAPASAAAGARAILSLRACRPLQPGCVAVLASALTTSLR